MVLDQAAFSGGLSMRRKGLLSLLGLILPALLYVQIGSARYEIRVDEHASRLLLTEITPRVSLAIANGSDHPLNALITVQLLDPSNKVVAETKSVESLKRGSQNSLLNLPTKTSELLAKSNSIFIWYRLHYSIRPEESTTITDGFISLSQITPELFALRVVGSSSVRLGAQYQAVVEATHPVTHEPASGVTIKGDITLDVNGKRATFERSAMTDKRGLSSLNFNLPAGQSDDEMDLEVEGRRGFVTDSLKRTVDLIDDSSALISTDKPLYQPGQTVHSRALVMDSSRRAMANRSITLRVTDPEDTVVFNSDLKTSRFGIASGDWTIPNNTRLGDYTLSFTDQGDSDKHLGVTTLKISRYDLPTFSVNVKPDRDYYLQGQDAEVKVKADYLFGQPVTSGRVKVIRETERHWNYREQKYDTVEGDKYEGELSANGQFKAALKLDSDFRHLTENDYSRFEDIPYAAYLTDASTNRTEQRRFTIRVAKQPIHVYIIHPNNRYYENRHLPVRFFLTTFYADGSPASCSVRISLEKDGDVNNKPAGTLKVRTNKYGLAVVPNLKLSLRENSSETKFNFVARDRSGKVGTHTESFNFDNDPAVRIEMSKSILAPQEPIEATISSSEKDLRLTLDVVQNWAVVQSQPVVLHDGRAVVSIPYRKEFKDEVTLSAYTPGEDDSLIADGQTVLYPHDRDLKLNLRAESSTYKPGERAHVSFNTLTADGKKMESALGVVVVDKAVEERVRTDNEFGSGYYGFYQRWFRDEHIGPVSLRSLERMSMTKPVPTELQMAAEFLLSSEQNFFPQVFRSNEHGQSARDAYSSLLQDSFDLIKTKLSIPYNVNGDYPKDEVKLTSLLARQGVDFHQMRDPWGVGYQTQFLTQRQSDLFVCTSAGPDKQFDTDDDLTIGTLSWPYFKSTGDLIDKAVDEFHQRTNNFIRDYSTLRKELLPQGIDLDQLRDPWNKPYEFEFEVTGNQYAIFVKSSEGASGPAESSRWHFVVWDSRINYFSKVEASIGSLLAKGLKDTGKFPENETEVRRVLVGSPVDLNILNDPWFRPYYVTVQTEDFFTDNVKIEVRSDGGTQKNRVAMKPITKRLVKVKIRSTGKDLQEGTVDDFTAAEFVTTLSTVNAREIKPQRPRESVSFSGSRGAISGVITDVQGACIANAHVTLTQGTTPNVYETTSDDQGRYLFRNVPAGVYELRSDAPGFTSSVVTNVIVRSSNVTEIDLSLQVGMISQSVTVTADGVAQQTESSSLSVSRSVNTSAAHMVKQQLSTPRIRDYFPETLVWQPELTTDKKGRANLDFTLADNITTWKMSVIGSTEDGQIGTADADIRSFQPFFAELDPPSVLTQGDRISLPVVLRNYLDKKQTIDVTLRPESWFQSSGANKKQVEVAAGDSKTETFDLQAIASIEKGTQQVTAIGSLLSDAIEKHVHVHPDGEEKVLTSSNLLDRTISLTIDIPPNAIAGSQNSELKIYPNLASHVWECIEGILRRPYGCAEQTISSSYPNVLILRYLKSTQRIDPIEQKAKRYLEAGYQRLLGYQSEDGGFAYWSNSQSDIALTAYALRFLKDAATFTTVDTRVTDAAYRYLLSHQQKDGRWIASYWSASEDAKRTGLLTALVLRSLAMENKSGTDPGTKKETASAVNRGLAYLQEKSSEIDEPYLIASLALAANSAGDSARSIEARERLMNLSHEEGDGSYWSLETNSPFYGWGFAGRVETSALAMQALSSIPEKDTAHQKRVDELIVRSLLFLLRNKDRYGVWYSTQATVNVLEALMSILTRPATPGQSNVAPSVRILVNGRSVKTIELPRDEKSIAPYTIDLSSFFSSGVNKLELIRTGVAPLASVQVVSNFYVPWSSQADTQTAATRSGDSEALKFETNFDKVNLRIGEEVTCRVKAERVGFKGYGMMLAEIGLPPGVDVERASLETAIKSSGWSINHYDVLPDRVIVYLWPKAGGTSFSFNFKPRLAMTAKTAASIIYDYYNPEAKAVVAPANFVVQ